ncbi:3191_t:CDS:2 [Dentiscutata erythropus]|uniref:3191_t:CDS:1 n=1 Tax=Dentiscutata erythropus TaxID=1348616 RepID=A0A9N9C7Z6_9GLOM|nr:3191_t:CDS:2 [Dentiscutata erythropus]
MTGSLTMFYQNNINFYQLEYINPIAAAVEDLGLTFQQLKHIDCSIQVTIFLPNTITIFEFNTKQQFYQSVEVPEDITNIHFPTLTTEFSFSSNSTDLLEANFYTPTLCSIISSTDLTNRESDTDSIDELVLSGAPSYLSEELIY